MSLDSTKPIVACPWCGSHKLVVVYVYAFGVRRGGYAVYCDHRRCGAEGPKRRTKAGAVRAWDRLWAKTPGPVVDNLDIVMSNYEIHTCPKCGKPWTRHINETGYRQCESCGEKLQWDSDATEEKT